MYNSAMRQADHYEKKTPFARTIAENPMRAVYPVSLVHECLLPTARILAHQANHPHAPFPEAKRVIRGI